MFRHVTNFTNNGKPALNYRSAVAIYNDIFPGGLSIGRPSHSKKQSVYAAGLWENTLVENDLGIFWLILDGFRLRSIKSDIDFTVFIGSV